MPRKKSALASLCPRFGGGCFYRDCADHACSGMADARVVTRQPNIKPTMLLRSKRRAFVSTQIILAKMVILDVQGDEGGME